MTIKEIVAAAERDQITFLLAPEELEEMMSFATTQARKLFPNNEAARAGFYAGVRWMLTPEDVSEDVDAE